MHVNITYWRNDSLKGLETCRVRDSRHSFPKHVHDTVYAVGLMEKGASYSLGPGRDDGLVDAGQIALINPGQVHSGVPAWERAVTYRMLYFDIDLMRSVAEELNAGQGMFPEFTSVVVNDPILQVKLFRLCASMADQSEGLERQSLSTPGCRRTFTEPSVASIWPRSFCARGCPLPRWPWRPVSPTKVTSPIISSSLRPPRRASMWMPAFKTT